MKTVFFSFPLVIWVAKLNTPICTAVWSAAGQKGPHFHIDTHRPGPGWRHQRRDDTGWKQAGKHWTESALKLQILVLSAYVSLPFAESTLAPAWFLAYVLLTRFFTKWFLFADHAQVGMSCRGNFSKNWSDPAFCETSQYSTESSSPSLPGDQQLPSSQRPLDTCEEKARSTHQDLDVSFLVQRGIWRREQAMVFFWTC